MPPKLAVSLKEGYLYAINLFYFIVSIIIIAVAGVAKGEAYIATVGILAGIITVGVFLMILSIVGAFATWKKKRPAMFAYMILLALLFIIQFSVSVAVLAFNTNEQRALVEQGWCGLEDADKNTVQSKFTCFGLYENGQDPSNFAGKTGPFRTCMKPGSLCVDQCPVPAGYCNSTMTTTTSTTTTTTISTATSNDTTTTTTTIPNPTTTINAGSCQGCYDTLKGQIASALKKGGGVGLGFAFTEILGVIAAFLYWRQGKEGSPNYRAFL